MLAKTLIDKHYGDTAQVAHAIAVGIGECQVLAAVRLRHAGIARRSLSTRYHHLSLRTRPTGNRDVRRISIGAKVTVELTVRIPGI